MLYYPHDNDTPKAPCGRNTKIQVLLEASHVRWHIGVLSIAMLVVLATKIDCQHSDITVVVHDASSTTLVTHYLGSLRCVEEHRGLSESNAIHYCEDNWSLGSRYLGLQPSSQRWTRSG